MNRSSPYYTLTFFVEFYNGRFYETMVAMNALEPAKHYARACKKTNGPSSGYRVRERQRAGRWVTHLVLESLAQTVARQALEAYDKPR